MGKTYLIAEILERIKRPVKLNVNQEYKLVTIRLNHKGVVLRECKKGAEIKSNMYEVKEGDFILSGIDARNGAFGIVPPELDGALVTNDFWYFQLNEEIISKKLFLELTATSWFDEICKRGSDGTTQRIRLQKDKFFNQKVLLPAREKQEEILHRLSLIKRGQVDLTREINHQRALLSKLKQAILQDAITGELTADWRKQHLNVDLATKLVRQIKDEKEQLIKRGEIKKEKPLPLISKAEIPFVIPEGWVWCRLGDICSKTGSGSTPKGGKSVYETKGIKFIRSQNVYNDGLRLNDVAFISKEIHNKMRGTIVKPADLLLNITGGSIGRCCVVPRNFDTGNINQHVAIVRVVDSKLAQFIHKVICSPYFQNEIVHAQTGAGREGLPKNKMDNILIALPGEQEMDVIVQKANSLLEKVRALEVEITQNEQHTQVLMQVVLKEVFSPIALQNIELVPEAAGF